MTWRVIGSSVFFGQSSFLLFFAPSSIHPSNPHLVRFKAKKRCQQVIKKIARTSVAAVLGYSFRV
eukprot:scaffold1724_cov158-Amphora_coffeaeformis.AAC.2